MTTNLFKAPAANGGFFMPLPLRPARPRGRE